MKRELYNLKIDSADIKSRVNRTLNADLRERKLYMKYKIFKTAIIAATVTAITAASVFAASPAGREAIENAISYFRSDKAEEMTSIEELSKYNEEVGKSVSKDGYTLTVDNVAADDNFIHVFYTIKSDSVPFYDENNTDAALYADTVRTGIWTECVINGALAGFANHNSRYGYFADPYTYKAAEKYNAALSDIPDIFTVELYAYKDSDKGIPVLEKLYTENIDKITDEDKAEVWYVSTEVNKSKVKVNCVTRDINIKLPWTGATVEKAVFSPFGNQLVMMTEAAESDFDTVARIDGFALYDENGKCLDILNTDLTWNTDGSSRNSLEFLKAGKDTKQLKFVPEEFVGHGDADIINQKISNLPLTYNLSEYGSVIVTDIRISDGEIDIDYYKDGYVPYNPGFMLTDENGENVEPGGKLGCTLITDVNYETSSYTARYVYEKYDENGKRVPADESVSAEALRGKLANLGIYTQHWFRLDFDNALTVDLK